MKSLILCLTFSQSFAQLYKASEKYEPVRHEETDKVLEPKEIKQAVKKMRRIMGWKKQSDEPPQEEIQTPWLNQTYWDSLEAKTRWELRKAYYEEQRKLDKKREEDKGLLVKEMEERKRLEAKFVNLIKERGKRVAFYFIDQFRNFKKKQKKEAKGRTKEPWKESKPGKPGPIERPALGQQPHILFILADDHGFHDIGYHMAEVLTPNLDKLANEGIKLENYYVQQVCTPTRAQLMTGRYQIRYGMQHGVVRPPQPDGVPLDEKLMPEALKQCGYNTDIIGKWHLGFFQKEYCPQNRGFDHFLGFLTGSQDFYTHQKCFTGMCGYDFREAYTGQEEVIRFDLNDTYSTGIFVEGLTKRLSKLDPKKPSFTFLSLQSVHAPLQAPKAFIDVYRNMKNRKRRNYNAMVTAMDKAVGDVVRAYKKYGFWENTVLVYSSDNGGNLKAGASNWPLRGAKGSLYEGGIRSIGFVHSPLLPLNRMGTVSTNLMHVTDWFPTFLHLAGCRGLDYGGKKLDGVSQVPALWSEIEDDYELKDEILHALDPLAKTKSAEDIRGDWKKPGEPLHARSFEITVSAALRMGKWKLITGVPGSTQGWGVPFTKFWGNATTIFDDVELPDVAYIDNLDMEDEDCEESCEDVTRERKRRADLFLPTEAQRRHRVSMRSRSRRSENDGVFLDLEGNPSQQALEFEMTMTDDQAHSALSERSTRSRSANLDKIDFKRRKQLQKQEERKKKKGKKRIGKVPLRSKTHLVQLFNIEEDPTEKNDVSDDHSDTVKIMLLKLADYYDAQVPPRFPAYDLDARPEAGDGVWRPWRKSADELNEMSDADKNAYVKATEDKFNHVDDSVRRKMNIISRVTSRRNDEMMALSLTNATRLGSNDTNLSPIPNGIMAPVKLKIAGMNYQNHGFGSGAGPELKPLTKEDREIKQMARDFYHAEREFQRLLREEAKRSRGS